MNKKILIPIFVMIILAFSVNAYNLTEGLQNYYSIDASNTSGNTVYDLHGSNDGTGTGITLNVTGKINEGAEYDSATDIINLGDIDGVDSYFTISMWVKLDSWSSGDYLFGKNTGAGQKQVYARWTADNGVRLVVYDGGAGLFADSTALSTTGWNFLVFIYNSSGAYVYNNDSLIGTATGSIGAINTDVDFKLGNSYGGGDAFDGIIDEVGIWNKDLNATEINALYNNGNGLSYYDFDSTSSTTDINFNAYYGNSSAIQNFTVYMTWENSTTETHSTTNGTIHLINVSDNNTTLTTILEVEGLQNQTSTNNITANTTNTINFNYYGLTIYAKDVQTSAYINNYQLNLTDGSYNKNYASTTNQTFEIIAGTYTINIDHPDYSTYNTEVNLSVSGTGSYTFTLYPTNSLNISFYDEDTNTLLTTENISYTLIYNDANATTGDTTNGTAFLQDLDAGEYEIRYSSTTNGYTERNSYFTLTNRSYNELKLYLGNTTALQDVTVQVYDEYGNQLEDYTVKLLKYYAEENGYVTVDEGKTNDEGKTVVNAELNSYYYKFRILDEDGTVKKTTTSTQIYETSITIYVTLSESIGQELEDLLSVTHSLTFLDETDQFKYSWTNTDGTVISATLNIYQVTNLGETLINTSTTSTSSGIIYLAVTPTNGTLYKAKSYVTFSGDTTPTQLDTLTKDYPQGLIFGGLGLFLTIIIVIAFAFLGLKNPAIPMITVPLALLITKLMNFHGLGWTYIVSLFALGGIIAFLIRDKT